MKNFEDLIVENFPSEISDAPKVIDFWRWAFSDLCDDDIKGWFAEWVICQICNIPSKRRVSWANSDIITPEGIRIEVKSSAFWQSWKLINEDGSKKSKIDYKVQPRNKVRFSGLITQDSVNTFKNKTASLKSDFYIFAFNNQENPENWNGLNLDDWEFYLLSMKDISALGSKSISLKTLESFGCLAPIELKKRVDELRKSVKVMEEF